MNTGALTVLLLMTWSALVLLSVSRRSQSALGWYQVAALCTVIAAVSVGWDNYSWLGLAALWLLVKVVAVPAILRLRLPQLAYGAAARGTPTLVIVATSILGLGWWAMGPSGIAVAVLGTSVWLAMMRHEVWLQALLLVGAELGVSLLSLLHPSLPELPEALAALEVGMLGALLAWLQRRGAEDFAHPPTTDHLTQLRG